MAASMVLHPQSRLSDIPRTLARGTEPYLAVAKPDDFWGSSMPLTGERHQGWQKLALN